MIDIAVAHDDVSRQLSTRRATFTTITRRDTSRFMMIASIRSYSMEVGAHSVGNTRCVPFTW